MRYQKKQKIAFIGLMMSYHDNEQLIHSLHVDKYICGKSLNYWNLFIMNKVNVTLNQFSKEVKTKRTE